MTTKVIISVAEPISMDYDKIFQVSLIDSGPSPAAKYVRYLFEGTKKALDQHLRTILMKHDGPWRHAGIYVLHVDVQANEVHVFRIQKIKLDAYKLDFAVEDVWKAPSGEPTLF